MENTSRVSHRSSHAYKETELHGRNYERPPPDLIDGEEEYEVERIIESRRFGRNRKVQYLVKWKGYPDSENQWVNWDDMEAPDLLADFKNRNPNSPTHIRRTIMKTDAPSLSSVFSHRLYHTHSMSDNGADSITSQSP